MPKVKTIEALELSPRQVLRQSPGILIGLALMLVGIICIITVILFIPGIFGVAIGLGLAYYAAPKQAVICPACETEGRVTVASKSYECEGCGTKSPVRWLKREEALSD